MKNTALTTLFLFLVTISCKSQSIRNLEIEDYSLKVNTLESKVIIQSGVIESKQNLIAFKDSTFSEYRAQQKKANFWSDVKTKASGIIILIETIALLVK